MRNCCPNCQEEIKFLDVEKCPNCQEEIYWKFDIKSNVYGVQLTKSQFIRIYEND